jgi:hypothetical protein
MSPAIPYSSTAAFAPSERRTAEGLKGPGGVKPGDRPPPAGGGHGGPTTSAAGGWSSTPQRSIPTPPRRGGDVGCPTAAGPRRSGRAAAAAGPGTGSWPPSLMRSVATLPAAAGRTTGLRRAPDVVRRVGGPADRGKRLAAVVVGRTAAGETMPGPPAQQAAAVGVPAADRAQALEEAILGWVTTRMLRTKSPAARDQGYDQCPEPQLACHNVLSPPAGGLPGFHGGLRRR